VHVLSVLKEHKDSKFYEFMGRNNYYTDWYYIVSHAFSEVCLVNKRSILAYIAGLHRRYGYGGESGVVQSKAQDTKSRTIGIKTIFFITNRLPG
jgi:hypothetical protein